VDSCRHPGELARKPQKANASAIMFILAMLALLVLAWRGESWAYIDPNAGGFLSQILFPFASIFLSFLFYCRKEIKRLAKSVRDRWKKIDSGDAPHEAGK
jgi:hypothetical protein